MHADLGVGFVDQGVYQRISARSGVGQVRGGDVAISVFVVGAQRFELLGGVVDRFAEVCIVSGCQADLDDDHASIVVVPVNGRLFTIQLTRSPLFSGTLGGSHRCRCYFERPAPRQFPNKRQSKCAQ